MIGVVLCVLAFTSLLRPVTAGWGIFPRGSKVTHTSARPSNGPPNAVPPGLPAPSCVKDDLPCEQDLAAFQVISELHSQLDDDKDGGVDPTEADGFLREELHYGGSGSSDRSKRFSRHDQHVSVLELWQRWKSGPVYNWTNADVVNWVETYVDLPQYKEMFLRQKIDGPSLPKLAMSSGSYLSNVLHVRNPVHRQKIIVKAIDAILFGAPRHSHNYIKDGILVALLCASLGGCWFAYTQYKKSQANLANMTQELDALTRKEESLIMVTQKLEEAERRQELDLREKTVLEQRYRKEVEEARAETDRLACERQSKAEIIDHLEMTERELERVKKMLAEAERKLRTGEGSISGFGETGGVLQMLLQMTYETEVAYHNRKRREAELQLVQARENCEKVRRKRAAFMGSLRVAHSTTLDDVDRSITEAKSALEEVKMDLQERQFRWTQLELMTGLPIMQNPGLVTLRKAYQAAQDSGQLEGFPMKRSLPRSQRSEEAACSRAGEELLRCTVPSEPDGLGDSAPTEATSAPAEGSLRRPEASAERPLFSVDDNSSQSSSETAAVSAPSPASPRPSSDSAMTSQTTKVTVRSKSSDQLRGRPPSPGSQGSGKSEENLSAASSATLPRSHSHHKNLLRSHKPSNPLRVLLRRKKPEVT